MTEAQETFAKVSNYMEALDNEIEKLAAKRLSGQAVSNILAEFFPLSKEMSDITIRNNRRQLANLRRCYFDAPDLKDMGHNGYRLINAVADFATHSSPIRRTENYNENLFLRTASGHKMIDRAYRMVKAA